MSVWYNFVFDYNQVERICPGYDQYTESTEPLTIKEDVLLLRPPKTVLGPRSVIKWDNGVQEIIYSHKDNINNVWLKTTKLYENDKTINLRTKWYKFDRLRDITIEDKMKFRSIVYNKITHKLYYIYTTKNGFGKKPKYIKNIYQMGLNIFNYNTYFHYYTHDVSNSKHLIIKFLKKVLDNSQQYVPDLYLPKYLEYELNTNILKNSRSVCLIAYYISIQARVGVRLGWLTDNIIENVSTYINSVSPHNTTYLTFAANNHKYRNFLDSLEKSRKNTIYSIVKKLKKNPTFKTLVKTLFGKHYKNIYNKVMAEYLGGNPSIMRTLVTTTALGYTNTYHHCAQLINKELSLSKERFYNYMREVESAIVNVCTRRDEDILNQFINLSRRVFNDGYAPITWLTFRDTLMMANALGVRIRLNEITDQCQLREIHNDLAALVNTNKENKSYKNCVFTKITQPEKKYDGFEFVQLLTEDELAAEGKAMHHCVGVYTKRCVNGMSLIFSMRKENKSHVTIELSGYKYGVVQKQGVSNEVITSPELLNPISQWHADLLELHKDDKLDYQELCRKGGNNG